MKKNIEKDGAFKPSLSISIAIVLFLFAVLVIQVIQVGSPDIHLTLVFAITFATVLLMIKGAKWEMIEEGILHGCKIATIPLMILMFIGILIPAWIASGTIPSLIFYGLQIISPSAFLPTAMIICFIGALTVGSSWSTAATFGVALMGISMGLGVPAPMAAGAVITGAVLGDKLSPVSDVVNLSAGVCEANLFENIKSGLYTAVPAAVIALGIYLFLGFKYTSGHFDKSSINIITDGISSNFMVTPVYALISLLPLILIIVMALKKASGLATMVLSALTAMIIAILVQGYGIYDMIGYMNYGFTIDSGIFEVDKLMNRGGLQSMMWTVSLGYLGLSFGGILEKTSVLDTLLFSTKSLTRNARNLVVTHVFAGILTNLLTASNYVGIIIPGRMFLPGYKKLGIKTTVASRTCQDSSTVVWSLVPWGLCGVYYSGTLGVSTWEYMPYAVLAWISPLIAILFACTGWFIWKEKNEPEIEGPESNTSNGNAASVLEVRGTEEKNRLPIE